MFNYPGEYVQLPLGVCSTTLGSIFDSPREYVQLPRGHAFYPLSPTSGCCGGGELTPLSLWPTAAAQGG